MREVRHRHVWGLSTLQLQGGYDQEQRTGDSTLTIELEDQYGLAGHAERGVVMVYKEIQMQFGHVNRITGSTAGQDQRR